jgi:predicted ABC-type ATPase
LSVLTIIAGPNGAGKSTHSKELLIESGIEAFDFDKEFYALWSKFGFDPAVEGGAFQRAEELYEQQKASALGNHSNFAFETNYHTEVIPGVIESFKMKGYRLELIFICLESPELAMERVKDRVSKGGHYVDEATIRSRFFAGLDLLDRTFKNFDLVTIYTSQQNNVLLSYVLEPAQNAITVLSPIPLSIRGYLPQLLNYP